MKRLKVSLVFASMCLLAGCVATRPADFGSDQAKRPERMGIHLDSTVAGFRGAGGAMGISPSGQKSRQVSNEDMFNSIKVSVPECFAQAYVDVVEVPSGPPYKPEALSKAGLDCVLVVGLKESKFTPPILLAVEGYRGQVTLDYKLYGSDGDLSASGSVTGKAFDRCLVLRFGGKKILSRVCANAVRAAVLKMRTEVCQK